MGSHLRKLALAVTIVAGGCAPSQLENGSFFAELNGFRIHYEVHGRGPVVMAVPNSWGLSLEGLRALYRPLEDRVTMVYFDPRGMGRSEPIREEKDMGMAAVREDFEALRRTLGLDRVAAIGWSNGAMNLILLAAEHPETLSSAIFVHGAARYTEREIEEFPRLYPEVYARVTRFQSELAAATIGKAEKDARLARFVVEDYFPLLFADPQAGRAMLRDMYRDTRFSWSHMAYSSAETRTFDYTDRLPLVRARCLVIAGAHDLLPPEKVRELHTGVDGSRFVLFEKSGHFAPVEEAESFKKTLLDFLE